MESGRVGPVLAARRDMICSIMDALHSFALEFALITGGTAAVLGALAKLVTALAAWPQKKIYKVA